MAGEVLSGPERRRRWGGEEKARLVAEIMVPGAKVTEIARRHGISRSLLYTWRREAGQAAAIGSAASPLPDLVPVMITDGAEVSKRPALPAERVGAATKGIGTIEIALPGSVRVTVRGRIEERTLRAVLGALRSV
jgi:transposase